MSGGVVLFALICLAAHRATRLIVSDSILDRPRQRWFTRFPPEPPRNHKLGQLVECPWCVGFWAAGAVTLAVWAWIGCPLPLLVWPAAATVVGLLAETSSLMERH